MVVQQQELRRWVDLSARLLSPACATATEDLARAIGETFGAAVVAAVVRTGRSCRVERLGDPCAVPVDVGFYARHGLDAPLLRHFRRWPGDRHVRASQEVDPCSALPGAALVQGRLRADGLAHALAFPFPVGDAGQGRWWVVARAAPFDAGERELARVVHPLVVGLDHHAAAMAALGALALPARTAPTRASGDPSGGERPRLTTRENTVLELMAQGLIATAIGHRLGVSSRTVSKHQGHIYRKLGTTDRLTTVLRAQSEGLLTSPHPAHGRP